MPHHDGHTTDLDDLTDEELGRELLRAQRESARGCFDVEGMSALCEAIMTELRYHSGTA